MLDEDDLREIGIQNPEHIRYSHLRYLEISISLEHPWVQFVAKFLVPVFRKHIQSGTVIETGFYENGTLHTPVSTKL